MTAATVERPLDLSVVIPVYNNAATLDELLHRISVTLAPLGLAFEVICVDDGSTDTSWSILSRRAAADPRIRPLRLSRNFGSQSALCAGFDQVRGRLTVCLDADLENFPEDIPALLAPLIRGVDLVCGVRDSRQRTFWRRQSSRAFNAFVRHQLGTTLHDIGCGMRAMDSRLVHQLAAAGERRRLLTPLLLERAHSTVEVPIRHRPSPTPSHSLTTLLGISVDFFLLTARRPFLLVGMVAGAGALVGAALLTATAFGSGEAPSALAGLILAVGGFIGCIVALVGEYAQRCYQLSQGLPFYELHTSGPDDSKLPSPPEVP